MCLVDTSSCSNNNHRNGPKYNLAEICNYFIQPSIYNNV